MGNTVAMRYTCRQQKNPIIFDFISVTDLRLAVQFTVRSRHFKVQLIVEDETGSAQT